MPLDCAHAAPTTTTLAVVVHGTSVVAPSLEARAHTLAPTPLWRCLCAHETVALCVRVRAHTHTHTEHRRAHTHGARAHAGHTNGRSGGVGVAIDACVATMHGLPTLGRRVRGSPPCSACVAARPAMRERAHRPGQARRHGRMPHNSVTKDSHTPTPASTALEAGPARRAARA